MALVQILEGLNSPCADCASKGFGEIDPKRAVGWALAGVVLGGVLGFVAMKMMKKDDDDDTVFVLDEGQLPPYRAFKAQFDDLMGREKFPITLKGADATAAEGTGLGSGEYGPRELYRGLQNLARKYKSGNKSAGNLCRGLLESLDFEWSG